MKKLSFLFFLALFVTIFTCEEVPPVINPQMGGQGPDDPTPIEEQERQVLVEEFTGVQCVNCPAGSQAIENLINNTYGSRLIAVSIHSSGNFSVPHEDSQYDFRTSDGNSILSYLGEPFGYPTAVVNRKKFDGEFDLQLGQNQWPGFIANELEIEPKVRIGIEKDYNEVTRELRIDVRLFVSEAIEEEEVRLSIMITENNVEDYQLTPSGGVLNYKHKHVLRDLVTAPDGDILNEELIEGADFTKEFTASLDEEWKADNCHLIAFVHLNGEEKDVLQAHQISASE